MTGFATSILSLLLGWLRTLLNNLWILLGSEEGSSLMGFLQRNWIAVFLVVCIGGFVVDRLVFFFRWRPDYVWRTKLNRLRHRQEELPSPATDAAYAAYLPPEEMYAPPQEDTYPVSPMTYTASQATITNAEYNDLYAGEDDPDEEAEDLPYAPFAQAQDYAPSMSMPVVSPYSTDIAPDQLEPIFDEPTSTWAPVSGQAYAPPPMASYAQPYENPMLDMNPSFGASVPEPEGYMHEIQPLYPMPPLEPPTALPLQPTTPAGPVHPGLDLETFQQNIGLDSQELYDETLAPDLHPAVDFPDTTFVPFFQNAEQSTGKRVRSGIASLAQRARSLVSVDDEKNPPTIRDLQSKVDMKNAFHPPVLPKDPMEGGEE